MPRTGGVYSPPAGTKGVPNTTIQSVPYNTLIDDLTADANAPRPVTAGGTGATSASGARTALGVEIGSNVQAYDAALQSIAGQTTVANQILYTTATDAYATTALTPLARDLVGDATAAAMKTRLGLAAVASSGSAGDLTTGKLSDDRLPSTMTAKTITGALTAQGFVTTGANHGIELGPPNTANTPFIDFHSGGSGADYDARIMASGGNASLGQAGLTYIAHGGHYFTGGIIGVGAAFSSNVSAVNFVASGGSGGAMYILSNSDRVLAFQSAASVTRGTIVSSQANAAMQIGVWNTSGVFQQLASWHETGLYSWSGHIARLGGNGPSGEIQLLTNNIGHSYRMIGVNDGGLYIQRSSDRFVSNAPTLLSWSGMNEATFPSNVYAPRFIATANGDGQAIKVGDDVWLGDVNQADTLSVRGQANLANGWIQFGYGGNKLGVNGSVGDRLYWGGSFFIQSDGNMYMPMWGDYLGNVVNGKAGIHTGGTRDELNFPIGHTILVETGNADIKERNSSHAIYLNSSYGYGFGGGGAQLAGTWRARGGYDSPGSGAWAYCFVRTA